MSFDTNLHLITPRSNESEFNEKMSSNQSESTVYALALDGILLKEKECPICFKNRQLTWVHPPSTTSTSHEACFPCLDRMHALAEQVLCPVCRAPSEDSPLDRFLMRLVRLIRQSTVDQPSIQALFLSASKAQLKIPEHRLQEALLSIFSGSRFSGTYSSIICAFIYYAETQGELIHRLKFVELCCNAIEIGEITGLDIIWKYMREKNIAFRMNDLRKIFDEASRQKQQAVCEFILHEYIKNFPRSEAMLFLKHAEEMGVNFDPIYLDPPPDPFSEPTEAELIKIFDEAARQKQQAVCEYIFYQYKKNFKDSQVELFLKHAEEMGVSFDSACFEQIANRIRTDIEENGDRREIDMDLS